MMLFFQAVLEMKAVVAGAMMLLGRNNIIFTELTIFQFIKFLIAY